MMPAFSFLQFMFLKIIHVHTKAFTQSTILMFSHPNVRRMAFTQHGYTKTNTNCQTPAFTSSVSWSTTPKALLCYFQNTTNKSCKMPQQLLTNNSHLAQIFHSQNKFRQRGFLFHFLLLPGSINVVCGR